MLRFQLSSRMRLCCMGQRAGRTLPYPVLVSHDPDALRASKVQHAVQRADGDGQLGRATPAPL